MRSFFRRHTARAPQRLHDTDPFKVRAIKLWRQEEGKIPVRRIANRLKISQRSLETYFKRHFGVTLYRYFLRRRLTLVHEQLLRADPATDRVTDIATGLGFGELGRFSLEYRKHFGETPSDTLRRPVGGPSRIPVVELKDF